MMPDNYYSVAKRFQDKENQMTKELTMIELKHSLKGLVKFGTHKAVEQVVREMINEGLIKENITVTYTWNK